MRTLALAGLLAVALALTGCGGNDSDEITQVTLGEADVHSLNVDTGVVTNLTDEEGEDYGGVWSPDGSKIAFTSNRDGNWEVYVMDADGTDPTNLTSSPHDDWEPFWAPTGSRLVFVSNRNGGPDLYIMNGDGTGVQRLTDNAARDWEPAWSPDGKKIIFSSDRDGDFEIYSIAAPEEEEEDDDEPAPAQVTYPTATQLTTNTDEDTHPGWSSNGSTVTYLTSKDGSSLYLMDADGTDARNGATTDWIRSTSSWANTATQLAYAKEQGVNWPRLWLLTNTANTPIAALQPTDAQADGYPAWSKDDKTLLFTRWTRTESPF